MKYVQKDISEGITLEEEEEVENGEEPLEKQLYTILK